MYSKHKIALGSYLGECVQIEEAIIVSLLIQTEPSIEEELSPFSFKFDSLYDQLYFYKSGEVPFNNCDLLHLKFTDQLVQIRILSQFNKTYVVFES